MNMDMKTIVLLYFIANLINAGLLTIIWHHYHAYYRGLLLLLADMIFQTIGSLFLLLRGVLPEFVSIVFSNSFMVAGALLVLIGLEQFFNQRKRNLHNYILFGVFLLSLIFYSTVHNDMRIREICISAVIILINGQSCWLLFHRLHPNYRRIAKVTAYALLAYIVVSAVRIVLLLIFPQQPRSFFSSGVIGSTAMTLYFALSVIVSASFILLVSRRLLEEVQTEKEKYSTTFNSSSYAILLTNISDGKIFEVNEGFSRITGYQASEVIGKTTIELGLWVKEEDRSALIGEITSGKEVRDWEMKFRGKDGGIMTGLVYAKAILVNGEACLLTSVSDITEMNRIKEKLQEMAMHDALTGLPNRKLFYDRAGIAIANARRDKEQIAILSLDVDLLKAVNDQYGHLAGDKVLITISNRLNDLLRRNDTIARFGGDEFLILLTGVTNLTDVNATTNKIVAHVAAPIDIDVGVIRVTASIGIAIYPEDDSDIEALIKKSDDVMYHVKANGRNSFKFYRDFIDKSI